MTNMIKLLVSVTPRSLIDVTLGRDWFKMVYLKDKYFFLLVKVIMQHLSELSLRCQVSHQRHTLSRPFCTNLQSVTDEISLNSLESSA